MSFGFSIGDFVLVLKLAKDVAAACRNGPKEYREICSEAKALETILTQLSDDVQDPTSLLNTKGAARSDELLNIVSSCENVLNEVQSLIRKHSKLVPEADVSTVKRTWHAHEVGVANLELSTGRMTFYVACINAFVQSLQGSAIARIERRVDQIYDMMVEKEMDVTHKNRPTSIASVAESVRFRLSSGSEEVWKEFKAALAGENISTACLATYKDDVVDYLKLKIHEYLPETHRDNSVVSNEDRFSTWYEDANSFSNEDASSVLSLTRPARSTGDIKQSSLNLPHHATFSNTRFDTYQSSCSGRALASYGQGSFQCGPQTIPAVDITRYLPIPPDYAPFSGVSLGAYQSSWSGNKLASYVHGPFRCGPQIVSVRAARRGQFSYSIPCMMIVIESQISAPCKRGDTSTFWLDILPCERSTAYYKDWGDRINILVPIVKSVHHKADEAGYELQDPRIHAHGMRLSVKSIWTCTKRKRISTSTFRFGMILEHNHRFWSGARLEVSFPGPYPFQDRFQYTSILSDEQCPDELNAAYLQQIVNDFS